MSAKVDKRLVQALLDAKARLDAGDISMLDAFIEQTEAMLDFPPIPIPIEGRQALEALIAALKDYMDGDETALKVFLGMPE